MSEPSFFVQPRDLADGHLGDAMTYAIDFALRDSAVRQDFERELLYGGAPRARRGSPNESAWAQDVKVGIKDLETLLGVEAHLLRSVSVPAPPMTMRWQAAQEALAAQLTLASWRPEVTTMQIDNERTMMRAYSQREPLGGIVAAVKRLVQERDEARAAAGWSDNDAPALGGERAEGTK